MYFQSKLSVLLKIPQYLLEMHWHKIFEQKKQRANGIEKVGTEKIICFSIQYEELQKIIFWG